jgi:hypothetical protein
LQEWERLLLVVLQQGLEQAPLQRQDWVLFRGLGQGLARWLLRDEDRVLRQGQSAASGRSA